MSKDILTDNLTTFYEEMDEILDSVNKACKQWYLEGLIHAYDSLSRLGAYGELTPFERENFIGSAKSWAYSRTYHKKLDPETRMRPLIESEDEGSTECMLFAAKIHQALGLPLDFEQKMRLQQMMMVQQIKRGHLVAKFTEDFTIPEPDALPVGDFNLEE